MTRRWNGRAFECVVVDLNTQHDFCALDGADPVANVEGLIPALRRIVAWAKWNRAPVISSIESHRPNEFTEHDHASCCVDGSPGQQKMDFTLLHPSAQIEVDNTLSCPVDLFRKYQQVIFRKRTEDLLRNPKADCFLNQLPTDDFIIFGVSLETSIKALALALRARDKRATIVVDACGYWNKGTADLALRQVAAKGAQLLTLSELLKRKLERNWRYRNGRRVRMAPRADSRQRSRRSGASKYSRPENGLRRKHANIRAPRTGGKGPDSHV
jgi:nicotinamidase-related amidase